ncbi:GDSL-type esterase/lipase family protein [Rhodanobacter sp. DHB23]|uniref:GDSL-type esterase/lipase family protein n=1 Tax=Rhodanobacter sp. DHB23 TaxID=2775923 RepID=UPI00177D76C9|nr:GDSL-type esterase/lipase family protein [Rhodanobacter sp. DHB23]MBD8871845.1 GDSL family lipase [Rhodanobacter sp. DHB23]
MTRAYRTVRFPCTATLAALLAAWLPLPAGAAAKPAAPAWVATWGQAMTSQYESVIGSDGKPAPDAWGQPVERAPTVAHLTLRQSVDVSAGGERVRIRLSNYYGREPLTVSVARIALGAGHAGDRSAIAPGSDRPLRFDGGKASITIAPGSEAVSDPVELQVPALSNVVVSLYFDGPAQLADAHPLERAHTTYAVDGDATQQPSLAQQPVARAWLRTRGDHIHLLAGVEVAAPAGTRGIVAFGDSITDGALASAPGKTWPAVLAGLAQRNGDAAAVVNAGISADELTTDQIGAPGAGSAGLKRFLRDVIDRSGVTDVVVLFGANDINRGIDAAGYPDGASAGDLIAGMRMLADVAHQHHLHIYAGTVTPFAGFPGWYSPQREAVRLQLNQWIRSSGAFDGVVDFADAVAGTYTPPPLVAKQSPLPVGMATVCAGDAGLHPNDRGYAVMGTLAYDVLFHAKLQPPQGCH